MTSKEGHHHDTCGCGHDHDHHHHDTCGCGHDHDHHHHDTCGCGHNHTHDGRTVICRKIMGRWSGKNRL